MMIIESILFFYFIYVVAYTAFFSISSFFYFVPSLPTVRSYLRHGHQRFCVLIPAYKEDAVIVETAHRAVHQSYPRELFEVIVIADQLQPDTLARLRQLPIRVEEVKFQQSTKVKSLREATGRLQSGFDYAVVLDADNIVEIDFLQKINSLVSAKRYKAIQVQRRAKNHNNKLAFLDGLSEAINTRIYRQGASAVGLSSSISGSGLVVDFELLKNYIQTTNAVGGFDRELELFLLKHGAKVHYYSGVYVKDEKVTDSRAFQGQRRRWISSQYFYLWKYFVPGMVALFKGDLVFFNSAVLRNVQLPRLINFGLLTAITVILFPFRKHLGFDYSWWPYLLLLNLIFTLAAVPREYYSSKLVDSVKELPSIFIKMIFLLFRMRGANKTFIHTPHTVNEQVQ
jgi:cellulose synthase/poly-beta-1,6-N-acetylglucosamine synthase-like glycosyltransferase